MQSYTGIVQCSPPLSPQEVQFLNTWQNKLNDIYVAFQSGNKNAPEQLDSFLGFDLNDGQRWTICQWTYCPFIKWTKEGMLLEGNHKKGQLRPAILGYLHLFLGEDPFIKKVLLDKLSFLKEHSFNGIIDSYKDEKQWLYIIKNNIISAVNNCSVEQYNNNPYIHPHISKEDNCIDKLNQYFSHLYFYADVNQNLHSKEIENNIIKRVKI